MLTKRNPSRPNYEHSPTVAKGIPDPRVIVVKGCQLRLEARLVVDVIRDVAVNARASSPDNIALGNNVVGASGASRNRARNSAVVNVADAESLVVNAHELTRSWA
jgi:hypothetical protein